MTASFLPPPWVDRTNEALNEGLMQPEALSLVRESIR